MLSLVMRYRTSWLPLHLHAFSFPPRSMATYLSCNTLLYMVTHLSSLQSHSLYLATLLATLYYLSLLSGTATFCFSQNKFRSPAVDQNILFQCRIGNTCDIRLLQPRALGTTATLQLKYEWNVITREDSIKLLCYIICLLCVFIRQRYRLNQWSLIQ